ncbi:hypothetical protein AB0F81_44525 [Actinoplanes sp. NPDC024001]|uniref:hypothetical protein n=1 Tax=Actinoplanes sp. NPDC024001 TaxID=3154598 RepID=UPI0033D60D36
MGATGDHLVERRRLTAAVEHSVATSPWTLLTGEPGSGRTTLLAALSRAHPDWLHFSATRDTLTALTRADPAGFLLAIGYQLARTRPHLFDPAGSSPFDRAAHAGVAAGRPYLDARILVPDALLDLALTAPAARLAAADPEAAIVILADLTGEPSGRLAAWLTGTPALPANVRFVLATQPHHARPARGDLAEVVIAAGAREAHKDLMGYAESTLPRSLAQRVADQAEGNFLYVAQYARSRATAPDPPRGLPALLTLVLDRARAPDAADGRGTSRGPSAGRDPQANRSPTVEQAVLGLLTVARAPLSAADIVRLSGLPISPAEVRDALRRLHPLLRESADRFLLFHDAIGDFLTTPETHASHPQWAVDPVEWHRRLTRSCLGARTTAGSAGDGGGGIGREPADVDWPAAGDYELVHLADHLVAAGEARRLTSLVRAGLRRAVRARFGHDLFFARVVELALEDTLGEKEEEAVSALPAVLFLSVVRGELARAAGSHLSPAVLGLAARLGRAAEAWEHAWAMPPSARRITALAEVARHADRCDLAEMVVEQATALGDSGACREAAVVLARYDLPRALELWDRAGPEVPPDPVYRAAGDPALFARMAAGRTAACLDAVASGFPADRGVLLLHAQSGLELLDGRDRVIALARLAELDPAGAGRYLPALRREAVLLDAERSRSDARALAGAAVLLAGVDESLAATLLSRCGRVVPEQARALLRLGRPDEARLALTVRLAESPGPEERLRIAEALEPLDPRRAAEVLDEVAAEVEAGRATAPGLITVLAGRDPERAAALARGAPAPERADLLAALGHQHLDEGRSALASGLLAELLVRAGQQLPLRDAEAGLPFGPADTRSAAGHQPFLRDVRLRWADRLRRRLYTDPAEVLRALSPGPSSPGSPHSLARVLRVYATELSSDPARPTLPSHPQPIDPARTTTAPSTAGTGTSSIPATTPTAREEASSEPATTATAPAEASVGRGGTSAGPAAARVGREGTSGPDGIPAVPRQRTRAADRVIGLRGTGLAAAGEESADPGLAARVAAAELAAAIEDRGEAAVAQAALVAAAIRDRDLDGEAHAWRRLRNLIVRMPRGHWHSGGPELDRSHLAYLRPDYRARFDTAIGVLPYQPDLGAALLTDLPALGMVFQLTFGCDSSHRYTAQRLAGRRPDPAAAQVHESLRRQSPGALPDPVLGAVVTATVSANEQMLGGAELSVEDPVYRLHARLTARTRRSALPGAGPGEPVRAGSLDPERLAAYAEIVRRNAGSPVVAALAGQVLAAAAGRSDEALLILAEAGYGDPRALLADLLPRLPRMSPAARDDLLPELSVLLFRHDPPRALRFLSDAASQRWPVAAAILEHAAPELLAAAGPRIGHALHAAVVRAVDCCAPTGDDRPAVIDGTFRNGTAA